MIREVIDIFNRNIVLIVWIGLALVIPVTFFTFCAITYVSMLDTVESSNLIAAFLIILNFTILFPPFLYMAKNDLNDKQTRFIDLMGIFIGKFGFTALFTFIFFLIAIFGSALFFIPSIFAIITILLLPLFSDEDRIKEAFKGTWGIVRSEHLFILLDLLIILSLNLLVWSGSLYLLASFENNTLVFITIRVLLNALFFPLIYFYLIMKYRRDLGDEYGT